MYCSKCGKKINTQYRYCNYCGSPNDNKIENNKVKNVQKKGSKKHLFIIFLGFVVISIVLMIIVVNKKSQEKNELSNGGITKELGGLDIKDEEKNNNGYTKKSNNIEPYATIEGKTLPFSEMGLSDLNQVSGGLLNLKMGLTLYDENGKDISLADESIDSFYDKYKDFYNSDCFIMKDYLGGSICSREDLKCLASSYKIYTHEYTLSDGLDYNMSEDEKNKLGYYNINQISKHSGYNSLLLGMESSYGTVFVDNTGYTYMKDYQEDYEKLINGNEKELAYYNELVNILKSCRLIDDDNTDSIIKALNECVDQYDGKESVAYLENGTTEMVSYEYSDQEKRTIY